jgi:hypothetical protein
MDAAVWLVLVGLGVTVYVAVFTTWQALRSGTAEVRYVDHKVYPSGSGWHVAVDVRNRGPGSAYQVAGWVAPSGATEGGPGDDASFPTLPPGAPGNVILYLSPEAAEGAAVHVWLRWRDKRPEVQERDTGEVVVRPGEPER